MEMKRLVFQAAVGIMSAALLTGCSHDVIEHQFHIDTQTNNASVTEIINANDLMQTFDQYLKLHGFDIRTVLRTEAKEDLISTDSSAGIVPLDDVSIRDISPEKLNEWVKNPDNRLCIYTECEPDGGLYEQLPIIMNHMNKFYIALQSLGDGWSDGEAFEGKEDMFFLSSMVEQDGTYYIESILTTQYVPD